MRFALGKGVSQVVHLKGEPGFSDNTFRESAFCIVYSITLMREQMRNIVFGVARVEDATETACKTPHSAAKT